MSSGSAALGILGAGIGAALGGWNPILWGFMAGNMAGSVLFPSKTQQSGARITDTAVQTCAYGQYIFRPYGLFRLSGNLIWCSEMREVESAVDQGGKGDIFGGSASAQSYAYYRDLAVGLCEGPIDAVLRCWAGKTLIYDAEAESNLYGMVWYPGSATQEQDPTIVALQGADDTPAFRDLAYAVFPNFPLSDFSNAIPQFSFELQAEV